MALIGALTKILTTRTKAFVITAISFILIYGLVNLTPSYAAAELNLAESNPSPLSLSGVQFPRNSQILYRGTNEGQFHYIRAIKAMLGDSLSPLESPMYASIKDLLLQKPAPLFAKISGLQNEYTALGIQTHIDSILKGRSQKLTEKEAQSATLEIMNTVYNSLFAKMRVYDYSSSQRDDFPKSFIYSTVYIEVAKIYSPNIVAFKERVPRSLDANFWNKVNNGIWVHTRLTFPDRGEFITPFYIPAEDITGYQLLRKEFVPTWNVWRPLSADLGLVFMKKRVGKSSVVYVFDATGLQHIVEVEGEFCSAKTQFDPRQDIPEHPIADCSVKPKLISILKRCSVQETVTKKCQLPETAFNQYPRTQSSPHEIESSVERIEFSNGDRIVSLKRSNP